MRFLPSHPDYPLYDELWRTYAIALNPQCWMGEVRQWDMGIAPAGWLDTLEGLMQALLEGLPTEYVEWRVPND